MVVWDLEKLHPVADTEKLLSELQEKAKKFMACRSELNENLSVERFMELVKKKEEINYLGSRLSVRAGLAFSENTSDSEAIARRARISDVGTHIGNDLRFFSLWFKSLDDASAQKYIDGAGKYRYYLEEMRNFKPYTLSEAEERVASLKGSSGASVLDKLYSIITSKFTYDWQGKQITVEELNQHMKSLDRQERVDGYEIKFTRYGEEEAVLSELYRNIVLDWYNDCITLRGMASPIAVRNLANDVPDAAIDVLLSVVRENVSLFQEYFALKAKACKLPDFDRYDLYVPYTEPSKEYPYEFSKKYVLETYKQFSEEFYLAAKKIFDMELVHSEVVPNKRSGAFSWSSIYDMPPYLMLNHVGKMNDVFTMMHECGHGIHSVLAAGQTQFTFHSALPLAETASTFGEMLLSQRLLSEASTDEEKIYLLMHELDGHYASVARQAYFVLFEKMAHAKIKEGATVEELNRLYYSTLTEQFGDIPVADCFQHEWKYISHIFRSPFYCYAYVFGELLVLALYRMYEQEGDAFVEKYTKILSAGGSRAPADILSEVGIDICDKAFWEQGFTVIREKVEALKKLTS